MVTKEVLDYSLVVGNPSKPIGWVSEYGHRLAFENDLAVCEESEDSYQLKDGFVNKVI